MWSNFKKLARQLVTKTLEDLPNKNYYNFLVEVEARWRLYKEDLAASMARKDVKVEEKMKILKREEKRDFVDVEGVETTLEAASAAPKMKKEHNSKKQHEELKTVNKPRKKTSEDKTAPLYQKLKRKNKMRESLKDMDDPS
jgi:hypothetical protein